MKKKSLELRAYNPEIAEELLKKQGYRVEAVSAADIFPREIYTKSREKIARFGRDGFIKLHCNSEDASQLIEVINLCYFLTSNNILYYK